MDKACASHRPFLFSQKTNTMLAEMLSPLDRDRFEIEWKEGTLGHSTSKFFDRLPDLEGIGMAIVGINDSRGNTDNEGSADAADAVRDALYELMGNPIPWVDLGNIKAGHTIADTRFAVKTVCWELIRQNIVPILIGGSHDLAFGQYLAYQNYDKTIDLVSIDSRFHLEAREEELDAHNYLYQLIAHQPTHLFNYINLGYQTYLVSQEEIRLIEKLYFDAIRLGEIRSQLEEAEPYLRAADMLTIDVSAIRWSEAPGQAKPSPNGFFAHELCQLARYAGLSDKLSSIGFYEYNPHRDHHGITAALFAQAIWYFADGFMNRMSDLPRVKNKSFIKYTTTLKAGKHDLVFYKSKKSGRWWMEVHLPPIKGSKKDRTHLVPCSYNDYLMAGKDELPDKWWKFHQKYMV
jgi:arginase family enzyme